eukprot:NODE_1099_length_2215_cov_0.462193.p3 type:complete len:123 gc:universal NODE_1099_length_2215_cov_0.462193:1053-685(-)
MKPISIICFVGGILDAIGFAFGNYIWSAVGFTLSFYVVTSLIQFGDNIHSKDLKTIRILSALYFLFNLSFAIQIAVTKIEEQLYDRWGFIGVTSGTNSIFTIKIVIVSAFCIAIALFATRLK